METDYEIVYTVENYWDKPIEGIANFMGRPYIFRCEFDEHEDEYSKRYFLKPISEDVLQLALEMWNIWLRWQDAFHAGETGLEARPNPALVNESSRRDELLKILEPHYKFFPGEAHIAYGEFKIFVIENERKWRKKYQVKWTIDPFKW